MEQDNSTAAALIDFVSKTVLTAATTSIRDNGLLVISNDDEKIIADIFNNSVDIIRGAVVNNLGESEKVLNTNKFLGDILNNMAVAYKIMSEAAVKQMDSLKVEGQ